MATIRLVGVSAEVEVSAVAGVSVAEAGAVVTVAAAGPQAANTMLTASSRLITAKSLLFILFSSGKDNMGLELPAYISR